MNNAEKTLDLKPSCPLHIVWCFLSQCMRPPYKDNSTECLLLGKLPLQQEFLPLFLIRDNQDKVSDIFSISFCYVLLHTVQFVMVWVGFTVKLFKVLEKRTAYLPALSRTGKGPSGPALGKKSVYQRSSNSNS